MLEPSTGVLLISLLLNPVFPKYGVNIIPRLQHILSRPRARDNNLALGKHQQHHTGGLHPIHQAREDLRFVAAEGEMRSGAEALEADQQLAVAAADQILDFPVFELGLVPEPLDDARDFAPRQPGVVLASGPCYDHFACGKHERCGFGLADADNAGGESLGTVHGVASLLRYVWEVETAPKIEGRHDIPDSGALDGVGGGGLGELRWSRCLGLGGSHCEIRDGR